MSDNHWKIHKFGGSSLASAECFERVASIVGSLPGDQLGVVVSAMGGMTNDLLTLASLAESGDAAFNVDFVKIDTFPFVLVLLCFAKGELRIHSIFICKNIGDSCTLSDAISCLLIYHSQWDFNEMVEVTIFKHSCLWV